ncbi:tyrosine-protein phosphatase [Pseudomonas sp. EA_65y_Pfl2_P74]|uniref:tyrosine-protein phosphatase n=1 Tax=Pseudomonas sp. EA_65y_Pfl2_P74 TaxID=3088694 RepID=UPI0030DA2646
MSISTPLNFRPLNPLRRGAYLQHCIYRSSAFSSTTGASATITSHEISAFSGEIRWYVNLCSIEESSRMVPSTMWLGQFRRIDIPIEVPWCESASAKPTAQDYAAWYESMLDICGASFAKAFYVVASAAVDGVVFACRHGKDRTGLLAAAILEAAGTSRKLILEDYAKSGAALLLNAHTFAESWKKRGISREDYAQRFSLGDSPLRCLYSRIGRGTETPILDAIAGAAPLDLGFQTALKSVRAMSIY